MAAPTIAVLASTRAGPSPRKVKTDRLWSGSEVESRRRTSRDAPSAASRIAATTSPRRPSLMFGMHSMRLFIPLSESGSAMMVPLASCGQALTVVRAAYYADFSRGSHARDRPISGELLPFPRGSREGPANLSAHARARPRRPERGGASRLRLHPQDGPPVPAGAPASRIAPRRVSRNDRRPLALRAHRDRSGGRAAGPETAPGSRADRRPSRPVVWLALAAPPV